MAIEADFDRVRGIGADLDEALAELGIVEVEIVVFDEHRLPGVLELDETPVRERAFGSFEGLGLFLSDADEDDAIADGMLAAHPCGDFVFALAFLEVDDRELMALNEVLDAAHVTLGELPQESGRGNRKLQMAGQESNQPGFGLQAGDVTVEVKTVQTLDGESDVLVEDRFHRGQGFGRSFHGLSTRKLSLPAREIEAALWVCPVPRSGTYPTKLRLKPASGLVRWGST